MLSPFDENIFTDCQLVIRKSENGFQCDMTRLMIPGKVIEEKEKDDPKQDQKILENLCDSCAEFIVKAKKEGNEIKKEEIKESLRDFYKSMGDFNEFLLKKKENITYPTRERKSYVFCTLEELKEFMEGIFILESI